MPGMKTGQARSLFGQDQVIASTGPPQDNVINALIGMWEGKQDLSEI